MTTNASPELQDSGTTETDASDDDCGCGPLLACFDCYRAGDRGRPAIRRATEGDDCTGEGA